mgnify:CR=1 FL=1
MNDITHLKLKYVVRLVVERAETRPEGMPYVGLENIESRTGKLTGAQREGDGNEPDGVSTVNLFREGDVLFGKLRPYLAKGWQCTFDGACTTEALVLRPGFKINSAYLLKVLLSLEFIREVDATTFGSKMPRAEWEAIGNLEIPIPSLEKQREISARLDTETARLDALISEKQRLLNLLAEKRRAVIADFLTKGLNKDAPHRDSGIPWLGEILAHWQVKRLKFLAEVRGGITLGKDYGSQPLFEFPYLRVANVQDGFLDLSSVTTVMVPLSESENCALKDGDVLMNEGGDIDKLGRGCVWRMEIANCLHQNHVFCVRPFTVESEWLDLWTSSDAAKSYFESRAKRATNLASISAANIKELPVPLPPESEQISILQHVGFEIKKLNALTEATERTIALLQERRSALISAAVTGRLEVKNSAPMEASA